MNNADLTFEVKRKMRNRNARLRNAIKRLKRDEPEKAKYLVDAGKYSMFLSQGFLQRNNAMGNLELIKELFKKKFKLFIRMERSTKKETLMALADKVWENEQEIMKAFNFEVNKNFFRFWEMPKCTCPHMDNQERWGLDHGFIHTSNCPIHGSHTWKKK